jgi:putative RNA 2'-phosphotransferase
MSRESKFLARVLRHEPEAIGLKLDRNGWVSVDDLLRAMKKAGRRLSRDQLVEIVALNDKRRFTLSEDGHRIRAAQGHSVEVDLGLPPAIPPHSLYHGTAARNLDAIFAHGLLPGRRRHVHLSPDPETAIRVGERHGKPVVLRIDAAAMQADGHTFYCADNGVWLTAGVHVHYLGFGTANGAMDS